MEPCDGRRCTMQKGYDPATCEYLSVCPNYTVHKEPDNNLYPGAVAIEQLLSSDAFAQYFVSLESPRRLDLIRPILAGYFASIQAAQFRAAFPLDLKEE